MNLKTFFGIKGKLLMLIGFAVGVFGGLALYSSYTIYDLGGQIKVLGSERLPKSDLLGDMKGAINAVPRYLWIALETPAATREQYLEKVSDNLAIIKESLDHYAELPSTPESADQLQELQDLYPKLAELVNSAKTTLAVGLAETDKQSKEQLSVNLPPVASRMTILVIEISEIAKAQNIMAVVEVETNIGKSQMWIWSASCLLAIFLIGTGIYLSTSFSKQLIFITEAIGHATHQVSSASHELSKSADTLSSSSQQQASAIEEASASLTQIAGMVEANVKGAESANESAKQVYEISESTQLSMAELANAMSSILDSNQRIEKLVKVIEEIGEKTEVIDEIVFKTQLLSFNASVEAERAGDYGRGFAVVAQEVGNLAQMSGKAATEISSILKSSISEANSVAAENKAKVDIGVELAETTKAKMSKVLEELTLILEGTNKIVAAGKEQSQGTSQIATSIDALNNITQETANTAQQSASAGTELSGQSDSLMGLVNDLRNIVLGFQKEKSAQAPSQQVSAHQAGKVLKFENRSHESAPSYPTNHAVGQSETSSHGGDAWEKL